MRLRWHLVSMVVVTLLPALVFSAWMLDRFLADHRAAVERGLLDRTRAVSMAVEAEVQTSLTTLEALATSEYLDSGDLRRFSEQVARVNAWQRWFTVWLIGPTGEALLNVVQPFGTSLFTVDDRNHFKRVLETHRPEVSSVTMGPPSSARGVTLAVPVMRDGVLKYVLAAGIEAASLNGLLTRQAIPSGGFLSIADRNGVFIARIPGGERLVGHPTPAASVTRAPERSEGVVRVAAIDGGEAYRAFRQLPLSEWTVGVSVPADAIDVPMRRLLWSVAGGGGFLLVGGMGVALFMGHRIARSIAAAGEVATTLARGEPVKARRSGVREVRDLLQALEGTAVLRTRLHEAERRARMDAEEALDRLQANQERLERLVDTNLIGVIFGEEERITAGNHAFLTMLGYRREDIEAGKVTWPSLTSPEYAHLDAQWRRESVATGECAPYEKECVRADGSRIWVLVGTVRLSRSSLEWIGFVVDISERKQAENELAAALLKEQEARVAAESANRAKDRFLAVLSHELRTPLNSMLGWTRVLQEQERDRAPAVHALGVLERNVRHQVQLIDDLLDVSRIVSGKLNVSLAPIDLAPVIEMAIDAARGLAEARKISLTSELPPMTARVLGDAERLQQVVSNLLTNALKFTPEGGQVAVRLDRVGTRARVTVADTGSGIAPESLPHVFDRFWQADNSDTRAHGGLGLGLAIVRHLVAAHGGVVRAESAGEGQGATFIVELPTIGARSEGSLTAVARVENRPRTLPRLDNVRVLLVDDDADTLELFTRVLESQGAVVGAAGTVHDAVEVSDELDPHVIVSDISMPGADGFELIELIKSRRGEVPNPPFIAVTAYARADARNQILAAGFRHHLAKPVEPADLVTTVAALAEPRLSRA